MQEVFREIMTQQADNLLKLQDSDYLPVLEAAINAMLRTLKDGGKILLAGNGGSAADAQHFAGEIVGRFLKERAALPAISLCVDPSVMTCIGNDYGYDQVFVRQLQGLGKPGDVFLGISTSGNSANIYNAVLEAKSMGITTVGLLGKTGGTLKDACDHALVVPFNETPRIQEVHTMTVHMICGEIERGIFG